MAEEGKRGNLPLHIGLAGALEKLCIDFTALECFILISQHISTFDGGDIKQANYGKNKTTRQYMYIYS